jgi:predicted secreted protein
MEVRMPDSLAQLGYGATFEIQNDDSPGVYTVLDEVRNIMPPSADVDMIDVTHMQSPSGRREFIGGLIDPGEVSFEINWIPGNVTDVRLNGILDIPFGQSRRKTCRIVYPNHVVHTFSGELTKYEPSVPTDDKMTATVTFKVSGAITRGVT